MIHSLKVEFLNQINILSDSAKSGKPELPDQLSDFLAEHFEYQAVVLFKIINKETVVVYGKSSNAKKNYLKGATFTISLNTMFNEDTSFAINTDVNTDLQISEFVIYEGTILFQINHTQKVIFRIAKETPFSQTDVDVIRNICKLSATLLNDWIIAQGGEVSLSEHSLNDTILDTVQELRTPTNTIIGFTSILAEDNLSTSQIEYTNTIKRNAQQLLLILNDLIELSKIEANKYSVEKKDIDVKGFLSELIDIFKTKINSDLIELTFSVEKSVPAFLNVDDQKLRYILNTLLTFSKALTLHGKISLNIKIESNKNLVFIITDTGIGFSSDIQKNIFTPFSTKKIEELKKSNLTGLSLSIVQKIIKLQGGEIFIESSDSAGAKYVFNIPVELKEQVKGESNSIKPESLSSLPKPSPKSNKVLVIEDDYASSKLLSNYLNKWGYDPTIVNTEEQTLGLINKEIFLAVIMDIAIPNVNGLELLQKIHTHPNTKNTPVIVCSVEAEQQKAFLMGAVEYFQKPINYNYLVEVLTSYKLRKNSNILCVDDDLPTLNLVKQAIETAGFNAIDENVSANVMELIRDKDIDLAIVDLDMPTPNGFELIKLIKSEPKFSNLPIIIYTGKDNFQDDLSKIEGLFDELLDKRSVNIEDLAETINSMVNRIETPPTVQEVIEKKDVIKILFAEDYKHSQIIVTRLLKKNNFENVAVVDNGQEAFDLAKKEKFDLILMDMQMPVMNGFEATDNIRKLPGYKDTPIIALTAFAMKGDREKCLDAGATDYIPKPIDSKEFIEKVKYYTNTIK